MYSFLRWSFVKSYWRLCFKMVMLQLAPLPSPAGASTALWAWKVSAERLTFGGWIVSFISVTVWLITALSLFFISYVWLNMFKTMMRSADQLFFFSRCRELEGIQWKFQKPVQGSIQSIQMSPLWDYIQRLWWRLQRKRAKRCDAGVLWLWWLPRILRKRLFLWGWRKHLMFHAMCSSCLNLPHLLLILFYWILSFLLLH